MARLVGIWIIGELSIRRLYRVLLEPSDDNHEKAEQIFAGVLEPFLVGKKHRRLIP